MQRYCKNFDNGFLPSAKFISQATKIIYKINFIDFTKFLFHLFSSPSPRHPKIVLTLSFFVFGLETVLLKIADVDPTFSILSHLVSHSRFYPLFPAHSFLSFVSLCEYFRRVKRHKENLIFSNKTINSFAEKKNKIVADKNPSSAEFFIPSKYSIFNSQHQNRREGY